MRERVFPKLRKLGLIAGTALLTTAWMAEGALASPREAGSALVLPYFARPGESTQVIISSQADSARTVNINWISGGGTVDPDRWTSVNLNCDLAPRASTSLSMTHMGGFMRVELLCREEAGEISKVLVLDRTQGIVFARVRDPETAAALSDDILVGSALVSDTNVGRSYSVEGVAFAAGSGANNGDHVVTLDGVEYERPPASLRTTFRSGNGALETSLVLAVIDGRVGTQAPARMDLIFANESAQLFSRVFDFDCFEKIPLTDIDPRFERPFLGSEVGWLEIASTARPADGKVVGVIGWVIEEVADGGQIDPLSPEMTSGSASARPLRWSEDSLAGTPALDLF